MSTYEKFIQEITCSIDPVIFSLIDEELNILMLKKNGGKYDGQWVLPGGTLNKKDCTLDEGVKRVLKDKTGVGVNYLEQLKSYGSDERDERSWTLTVAYVALVNADKIGLKDSPAGEVVWMPIKKLDDIKIGYDHKMIIKDAIKRIRNKVNYSTLPVHLLEDEFTFPELQKVYEQILDSKLDKSSFRKKILESDFIEEIDGKLVKQGAHRPAQLYRRKGGEEIHNFSRNLKNKM